MIVIECFSDEALVRALCFSTKSIHHESGKGSVVNRVMKEACAIGLVDADPGANQPAKRKNWFISCEACGSLRRLEQKENARQQIIELCPRLEDWLLARARAKGVNPADFGVPMTAQELHGKRCNQLPRFRDFLDSLANDEEMTRLRYWLNSHSVARFPTATP